ncbi:MAG: hypothetical protein KC713_04030, partial [Candidatus Omnitrophica bacterium]|nr:hypothetical protein [Candidatus Omnitrophota bacterium]
VRERVLEVRKKMLADYLRKNPEKARSLYGIGDIGSWATKEIPDASMDIDWSVFGIDPTITAEARDEYIRQLTADLDNNGSGLTLQDFDVVVTAEGHERAAGVFETEGGIDWAKRNMKSFTVLQPDGRMRTYNLEKKIVIDADTGETITRIVGDPVGEMAMASQMAKLRKAATDGGDYEKLFDDNGFLRHDVFSDPDKTAAANELWDKYGDMLNLTNVDYYRTRLETASGGALDMSKHLQEEVLSKKFDPEARMRKTLKYLYRADNITRKGDPGLRKAIEADPLLSDPSYQKAIALSYEVTQDPDSVGEVLSREYGGTPDAALQQLGETSKKAILRMAEVSYQVEMDRIIMDIPTKEGRKAALDKLTHDFSVIADEGGEYSQLSKSVLDAIAKVQDVNESGGLEDMKKQWRTLEKIRHDESGIAKQTLDYLNQTELGRKMIENGGKFLEWGSQNVYEKATGKFKSDSVEFIGELVDSSRAKGQMIVDIAGSVSMWVEVLNSVRSAKSDVDLAYALGHTLVNNTFFGMIISTAYAGIVQGDNEALAKAIMYMLVPEAALPALVASLGESAINIGSQVLFETQLDALYLISTCGAEGNITEFFDSGKSDKQAALELIDDFLSPGGYAMAEEMLVAAKTKASETLQGTDVFMKAAVVKSMESTLMKGNPLLFTEDGPLMNACGGIKKTTEEIDYLAKTFGFEMHYEWGINGEWSPGLSSGQIAAMNTLIKQRDVFRQQAKNAMAEAIVRTFNERCKAETQLNEGQEKAMAFLKKCQDLFKRLGIEEKGMQSLEAEGAPYNLISSWMTSDQVKQRTAMIALQKYYEIYKKIEDMRAAAENIAGRILGEGRKLRPQPLTGSLPLTTSPERDLQIAQEYLQELSQVGDGCTKTLETKKQGALNSDYDQNTLRALYAFRVRQVYWQTYRKAAVAAKDLHWKSEIFDRLALDSESEKARQEADELKQKEEELLKEFEQHYNLEGRLSLKLEAPQEISSGERVELKAIVTLDGKTDIPAEINNRLSFIWKQGKADLGRRTEAVRSFLLDTEGKHEFAVTLYRSIRKAGKETSIKVDEASAAITVKQADDDEKKDKDDKKNNDKLEKELKDLTATLNTYKDDRDWQSLVNLIAQEDSNATLDNQVKKDRLKMINQALEDLQQEKLSWLKNSEEYLRKLFSATSSKRDAIYYFKENRWDGKKCKDCIETLEKELKGETQFISQSRKELPSHIEELSSGFHTSYAAWFKQVEEIRQKLQLPYPYPDPVETRVKRNCACLEQEDDETKKEKESVDLAVSLNGPTEVIEVGTMANISASVSGGVPPYMYEWSGASGYGATASMTPASIGDWTVSVQVTDADGFAARGSFVVRVKPNKVNLKGLEGDVFYGAFNTLNAWGMGMQEKEIPKMKEEPYPALDCANNGDNPFCVDTTHSGTIDYTKMGNRVASDDWSIREVTKENAPSVYIPDPDSEDLEPYIEQPPETYEYEFIWQSEPALSFDPPRCYDGLTKVTFDQVGEVKVWCEMLKMIEGAYQTVGECDQVEIKVKPPAFSISYSPPNGEAHIGEKVIATIHAKPSVKSELIDYRWLEPATSNRLELEKNGSRIEFTVKNTNPIKLQVLARVPVHGDDLGEINSSFTGVAYSVNAYMVQPPNLPRVWDPKKGGLKTLERNQRLTGERISLKAEIQGGKPPEGIRWQWTVNDGTSISNPNSQTPTVSRSSRGQITAAVVAYDGNKHMLGKADVSVSVIEDVPVPAGVKQDDKKNKAAVQKKSQVEEGDHKKQIEQAKKKFEESKQLAHRGKYDDAIEKAQEALKDDPNNPDIEDEIQKIKNNKQEVNSGLKKVEALINNHDYIEAQKQLIPMQNKASYYPPVQDMEQKLGNEWRAYTALVNAAMGDIHVKTENRDYEEALVAIAKAREELKLAPSELKTLAGQENYCKPLAAKKQKARELFKTSKQKFESGDYQGCIDDYMEGYNLTSNLWNVNKETDIHKAEEIYRQAVT